MAKKPFDHFGPDSGAFLTGDYATFAAEVGNVIWSWNHFHAALCDIFWVLTGIKNPKYPRAMWHSIRSDSAQRLMLGALVQTHKQDRPYGPLDFNRRQFFHSLDETIWLLNEANDLASFRNDATHTLWSKEFHRVIDLQNYQSPKAIPDIERGPSRGKRMTDKNPKYLFRDLSNYSIELAAYCNWVTCWLRMWGDSETFPERPSRPRALQQARPPK